MRKQRTHFAKAFKANAVKLSLERKNISELAQELGIAPFLLYRWRKEYQQKGEASFAGHGVQSLSEDSKRIAELEKCLGEAETERNILKKGLSIICSMPCERNGLAQQTLETTQSDDGCLSQL